LQRLHEANGVAFHLGRTIERIGADHVLLDDGTRLDAELVLLGVGVRPLTSLAEAAGLRVDDGVLVDRRMRTSDPAIWAAGDIARFPSRHADGPVRIEHWVVAQRQGQAAARGVLGVERAPDPVPFFWSRQY